MPFWAVVEKDVGTEKQKGDERSRQVNSQRTNPIKFLMAELSDAAMIG
jgi:hypothetical protein